MVESSGATCRPFLEGNGKLDMLSRGRAGAAN
jgi:hypothetical protein